MSAWYSPLLAAVLMLPSLAMARDVSTLHESDVAVPAQSSDADAPKGAPVGTIDIEGYHPDKNLFLERGSKFMVLVKGVDATALRVIYRPTSKVESLEAIGKIENQQVVWTPKQAGLARLEAYVVVDVTDKKGAQVMDKLGHPKTRAKILASRVVSIKRGEGFPIGLVIMALAGAILFFGAFASIKALLRA